MDSATVPDFFPFRLSMTIPRFPVVFAAFSLSSIIASAADKPYEVMDYGRFFAASFNNGAGKPTLDKKGAAANKGITRSRSPGP